MAVKRSYVYIYLLLFSLALLAVSCSQTKNTAALRGWHNMNARYNGTFNSSENQKEAIKKVEKANKDDFTKLLPLFVYPSDETAKNFFNDFDNTIKKSSVVIQRHVIMNPKTKLEIPNACRWIDENYMLIGKSHLYKRDLFSALEAFEYVSKIYPQPKAKYGGKLGMIRTDNEIGSYSLSEELIDELRSAKDFPKDRSYTREFALVSTDLYMRRGDYQQAIKQLTKAVALTRKKITKARYIYILAQLNEKVGDTQKASFYYSMVPKLHPNYDMEFSARINQARFYDISQGGSKAIKKQLMKMLRDDKNIDYQDQIYYALAEIAKKEGDVPTAIDYLASSIKASTTNTSQKALSYLKRGDIYFDQPDYKRAQANYDSAMTVLPKDYPDYQALDTKKNSLNNLITNLNVIAHEDSMQTYAKMSETERNVAIEKLIKQQEEDEKKAEEASKLEKEQVLSATPVTGAPLSGTPASNSWYFYNPSIVSFGIGEFKKKWGSRKLEDNWRRSEKEQVLATNDQEEDETKDSLKAAGELSKNTITAGSKKDKSYYLTQIPLTDGALTASNNRVIDAYYNAGSIYKEQLMNNQKSVEALEELLKRYPDNKYRLSTYYQLYRTNLSMNNQNRADYYKNLLLTNYPDSEYAKLIKNPDYAKDINATKSVVEHFYTETYELYSNAKYTEALENCLKAESQYAKSALMPQFSFLKALCIGRTQDINAFESALIQVVEKYPKSPVKEKAQEILEAIKKQKAPSSVEASAKTDSLPAVASKPSKFIFNESGEYFWVLIAENGKGDMNNFKIKLSKSNQELFSTLGIGISDMFLDGGHQMVITKTFNGKMEAMKYYNVMRTRRDTFLDLTEGSYQMFVISAENFGIFYKDKNVAEYQDFFTQNYK
ncbi:MAG TPA: tetratricopeptide repeat protein [Bacteroidia bacterium]|jgi:tetratricopeptide (TPR) repeat protein|nr:tetratricopeptide repeat protein [Bacteroidia bacterium]